MSDIDTLARTLYGEARGEGPRGLIAVANVIVNRAERGGWWGNSIETVCRKPWQFSCWNANDPNSAKLALLSEGDPVFLECLGVAALVVSHRRRNLRTDYADFPRNIYHYCTKQLYDTNPPDWAKGRMHDRAVFNHYFFANVE